MTADCPFCRGSGQVLTAREQRNAEWALLRAQGLSYPQIAARYGVNHTTVQSALKPAMRARQREQARYRYYLNKILPRELEAECAE